MGNRCRCGCSRSIGIGRVLREPTRSATGREVQECSGSVVQDMAWRSGLSPHAPDAIACFSSVRFAQGKSGDGEAVACEDDKSEEILTAER